MVFGCHCLPRIQLAAFLAFIKGETGLYKDDTLCTQRYDIHLSVCFRADFKSSYGVYIRFRCFRSLFSRNLVYVLSVL